MFAETSTGDVVNPQDDTRVVIAGGWKYLYRPGDVDELYDLESDPHELRNLSATPERAATLHRLQERLAAWMAQTADALRPSKRGVRA